MVRVCNLLWAEPEQHVAEWDKWVQKKLVRTGALEFRTVNNPPGPRREPVMVRKAALLDVAYADDDGTRGYVGVAYTNACSDDAQATLRAARTSGKSASKREEHMRKRYPPDKDPRAEVTLFVVEARGRLGAEVLSFLRQHAPAERPIRSAVLARATREISIITPRGLAALLLSAEPRPVVV